MRRTFRVAIYVQIDDDFDPRDYDPEHDEKIDEQVKADALLAHVKDPDNVDIEEML